jgi:hypothetical protein
MAFIDPDENCGFFTNGVLGVISGLWGFVVALAYRLILRLEMEFYSIVTLIQHATLFSKCYTLSLH